MKKSKILWLALSIALIIALITSVCVITALATDEPPILTVKTTSLELENAVFMNFKVQSQNINNTSNVKLLVWESYPEEYVKGTEDAVLSVMKTEADTGYLVFRYTDLAAKDMTKFIYVCAYTKANGEEIYSKPTKFSIVQYAYNTQTDATASSSLKALVSNMLMYGASAQTYFNHKTDFLATDPIVKIRTEGGTHADGFKTGYYKMGTKITLTANAPEMGMEFSHWENNGKDIVGTDMVLTLTAYTSETYTAVYKDKGSSSTPNPKPEKAYSKGLTYTLYGDEYNGRYYVVSGIGTCADTEIVIPDTYDAGDAHGALPVKAINPRAFADCWRLTSVVIPEGVVTIGNSAFESCDNLTEISIPNSVTIIGESAFAHCISLTSIVLPESVTIIGNQAFYGCIRLIGINIPSSVTSIGWGLFYGCSGLTGVNISNSVTSIEHLTFYGCSSLASINIPSSVTSIGNSAFSDCTSLTSIILPNGVTSIGDSAFEGCTSLTGINIPGSVTSIGESAFYGCSALASIILPDKITTIENNVFCGCANLKSVYISGGVTSIGSYAFYDCSSLNELRYGGTVAEWNRVTLGSWWKSNVPAKKIICTDGEAAI